MKLPFPPVPLFILFYNLPPSLYLSQAVLVSPPDLECGFSRDLFLHWSNNPHNSIIFTSKTAHNTLARTLVDNLKVKCPKYKPF